jgi:hypothetical protein
MPDKTSRSATEAGITIEPNPNRVIVRLDADIIADSTRVASALGFLGRPASEPGPLCRGDRVQGRATAAGGR